IFFFFFSSRRRHTRFSRDWSSDVCSSDLQIIADKKIVLGEVTGLIQKQVDRIRTTETSPKNTKLYFSLLLETKDLIQATINLLRSEERRVGKECRSRWWRYHYKKHMKTTI